MFDNLNLNAACKEQHENVLKKGFEPQPIATTLMLIVSELSEALEADRNENYANWGAFQKTFNLAEEEFYGDVKRAFLNAFHCDIKNSFEDEIADAFLRLMDLCGAMDIDIEKHIRMKAKYNTLRENKHGKKY